MSKTRIWSEDVIRDGADEPTLACLELWHSLCDKLFQTRIKVWKSPRKEFPPTAAMTGELNTAIPLIHQGKAILLLLIDDPSSHVEDVIITHEIGHWILKLQGFRTFINRRTRHGTMERMLNTYAQQQSLY